MSNVTIHGELFGARVESRMDEGKKIGKLVTILTEDDTFWHDTDMVFDIHWIHDLTRLIYKVAAMEGITIQLDEPDEEDKNEVHQGD